MEVNDITDAVDNFTDVVDNFLLQEEIVFGEGMMNYLDDAVVESQNGLNILNALPPLVEAAVVDDVVPQQIDDQSTQPRNVSLQQMKATCCTTESTRSHTISSGGSRYAMLRKALLDPVKEWRNIPDEYRNDKLFILQFLYKCNMHQLPLPSKNDFERKFPYHLRQDRDIIYTISQRYDFSNNIYVARHAYVPEQYKDDKYIMLSYCKNIQRSLQECSYRLQNDIDIVMTAIQNDGMELQYASVSMQQNEIVVRQACYSNICALDFCSSKLLRDKLLSDYDFVVNMLRTSGESIRNDIVEDNDHVNNFQLLNRQMRCTRKMLLNLVEPLRSNRELWLVGLEHNLLSYTELSKNILKYQNDIDFLIESISRRSSIYLELCQIPSKEQWYKSSTAITVSPPVPRSGNSCGTTTNMCDNISNSSNDNSNNNNNNLHSDCHRIAYATITSSTSDATIIAKVLDNIPTLLLSHEYRYNTLLHQAIVDRSDVAYMQEHLTTKFPYLLSNVEIMTRAVQRDCNLFVPCTEKDEPSILIAAMNADTAYPLLRTKPVDYVLEHIDDVLLHVINVSKMYHVLGPIIPENVWKNSISLQKAWIKRKGTLLPSTVHLLNEYSINNNNDNNTMNAVILDLAHYIAEHNGHQLFQLPLSLRSDYNFMLTAIRLSSGVAMQYGSTETIQQNIDCAIYTIAYTPLGGRAFGYIHHFTPQQINDYIQKSLFYHDTFVNPIVCTIYQAENTRNDVSLKDESDEARTVNPLQILNCGPETSTALLQRIAAFVGIPLGPTYEIYEKAQRTVYHSMNCINQPRRTITTTTNVIAETNQPPLQPPTHTDPRIAVELQRFAGRIRRDIRLLPPIHRDRHNDIDDILAFDADDENDMMELERLALAEDILAPDRQLDPLQEGNIDAAVADPNQNQQPVPPAVQQVSAIERFVLANAMEDFGRLPVARVNEGFIDPLQRLPLGQLDDYRAIIRRIRRRRLRDNDARPNILEEEELRFLRRLRAQQLLQIPPP